MNVLFVILIAFASAFVSFWQSGRILPLIDYSYQIENAYRIYCGQIPYKDFILVLPPGTYYIMAFIMKTFGLANIYQTIYISALSFFTVILTYLLLTVFNKNRRINIVFLAPLIFAGHSMYPFTSYDINTTFFMLLGLYFLIHVVLKQRMHFLSYYIAGILLAFPLLFKQNTGILFLLGALCGLFIYFFYERKKLLFKFYLSIFLGVGTVLALLFIFLFKNNALWEFYFQLFVFPSRVRTPFITGFNVILDFMSIKNVVMFVCFFLLGTYALKSKLKPIYKNSILMLAITIPLCIGPTIYSFFQASSLIKTNFNELVFYFAKNFYSLFFSIWYIVLLFVSFVLVIDHVVPKTKKIGLFLKFITILLILYVLGSFLSQGIVGSTYGLYPIFIIFISILFNYLSLHFTDIKWSYFFIFFIFLMTFFLSFYVYFNGRIFYIERGGQLHHFANERLKPLGTPGEWIKNMESMFDYVEEHIPYKETVIALPGEDPFYYATNRLPVLRYFQNFYQTFPYSTDTFASDIIKNKIDWIIVKYPLQNTGYNNSQEILKLLEKYYSQHKKLKGYIIYGRNL